MLCSQSTHGKRLHRPIGVPDLPFARVRVLRQQVWTRQATLEACRPVPVSTQQHARQQVQPGIIGPVSLRQDTRGRGGRGGRGREPDPGRGAGRPAPARPRPAHPARHCTAPHCTTVVQCRGARLITTPGPQCSAKGIIKSAASGPRGWGGRGGAGPSHAWFRGAG